MIFLSTTHENRFFQLLDRVEINGRKINVENQSVMYMIALIETGLGRNLANKIFDFENNSVRPNCVDDGWQTGTTCRATRLAFSLWNGFPSADQRDCNPFNLFGCEWDAYFIEALKIRYEID